MDTAPSNLVTLHYDDRGGGDRVAWVTFNNPEKRNALGLAGKDRFVEIMTSLRHDRSVRAVVVTGAGDKSFVGGTNLAEMAEFDLAAAEASATKTHRMCDSVRTCPVPVIARINGYCFGSGMELAACADMRVGADHAKFGMPETRHGIPSGMEASVLPRLIGWGKACELVLTGDHIDAQEAYRIGYLERLVPLSRLDAAVESWVTSLVACAECGPHPEASDHGLGSDVADRGRPRRHPGLRRRLSHRRAAPLHDGVSQSQEALRERGRNPPHSDAAG
jgi:enoyl-CoA hydratase/carnithine racemase